MSEPTKWPAGSFGDKTVRRLRAGLRRYLEPPLTEPDWDSYGSAPVSAVAVRAGLELVNSVPIPPENVAPCPDGGVEFYFEMSSVEIDSAGSVTVSVDHPLTGVPLHVDGVTFFDMRAVVIVEFWAMMAGALPYGWYINGCQRGSSFRMPVGPMGAGTEIAADHQSAVCVAWAAEYAARPRLEVPA